MKFWAVLGSRGCREKKLPTAISMQLFEVVFSTFCGQKNIFKFFEKYFSIRTKKLHNKIKKSSLVRSLVSGQEVINEHSTTISISNTNRTAS